MLSDHPSLPDTVTPSFARYALEGVKVGTVLDATREYPRSRTSVAEFIDAWTMPNQHDYLVVDDGEVSGIVSTNGLHSVRRGSHAAATLGKVMRTSTLDAGPDELIHDALERMTNASQTVIPVTDPESGRFLGSVTSADVIHLVVLMNEIQAELEQMETEDP